MGYLYWDTKSGNSVFEYDPAFVRSGPDIAPLTMPLNSARSEKGLPWTGNRDKLYQGLPPMLADSLPDKWGDSVFRIWLEQRAIPASKVTPVDRLSYIGSRGMGALEYEPAYGLGKEDFSVDVEELYLFARSILGERADVSFPKERELLWQDLVKIGTSAGGKRPKALVAINRETGEIRSGQTDIARGFEHYILKLDEATDYSSARIEYVYSQMAARAGIKMMPCEIIDRNGTTHFLTRRFDRDGNKKIHTQTLAALSPGVDSYEELFGVLRTLKMPYSDAEQLYRQMTFNVLAGNVDDHIKNFSFTMTPEGVWRLSPAYDLTFTIDLSAPGYVNRQSLTVNGKAEGITVADMENVARRVGISEARNIIREVEEAVGAFPALAQENAIPQTQIRSIERALNYRREKKNAVHVAAVSLKKKRNPSL